VMRPSATLNQIIDSAKWTEVKQKLSIN
jgi:hypothetical protein